MTIKAKPTKYCGVNFRSRTEAKYCMLFNMFDVAWTYESRRFPLPSGSYLPDFYLPGWNTWIEIKGIHPTDHERALCEELHRATKQQVIIAYGWPPSVLIWNGGSWVRSNGFGVLNMRLILGGKPLPTETYQEINEKIWSTYAKKGKRVRTSKSKKR
jgi:hypothetical protein